MGARRAGVLALSFFLLWHTMKNWSLEIFIGLATLTLGALGFYRARQEEGYVPFWDGTKWTAEAPNGDIVTIHAPAPPEPPPTIWEVKYQLKQAGY